MLRVVLVVSKKKLGAGSGKNLLFLRGCCRLLSSTSTSSSSTSPSHRRDPGLQWTSVLSHPKPQSRPVSDVPPRAEQVQRLQSLTQPLDVLVIGGGCTGVGCALDAASRGLTVACVDRGDFASETSSRSTKLIWAGIKYLGTASAGLLSPKLLTNPISTLRDFYSELRMVHSCHRERRYMTEQQSHLTSWVPLAVPFQTWYMNPPPLQHRLFSLFPLLAPIVFKFYDALSAFSCPPSHVLSKEKAVQALPTLATDKLKYCAVFYEGRHNDARTCLSIALTAAQYGAIAANYVEIVDLLSDSSTGKVVGAHAVDRMTGDNFEVRAHKVVLAGGPFTDAIREMESEESTTTKPAVQGASGTHIVLPGSYLGGSDMGVLDANTSDGRFLFILPWLGHTLIGTTDSISQAETSPRPLEEEIEWLLHESKKYLCRDLSFSRSDVLSAWRGWRPLAVDPHASPDAPVSRDHVISENPRTGTLFIAGGKWTTWREMAEEAIDRLVAGGDFKAAQKCTTLEIPLYGHSPRSAEELIQKYGLPQDVAQHLVETYGGHAEAVCRLQPPPADDDMRLVQGYPYIAADVIYACREYACTVEDILSRRTRLAFLNQQAALSAIPRVADLMAQELGWSAQVKEEQTEAATRYVESYGGPKAVRDDEGRRSREPKEDVSADFV